MNIIRNQVIFLLCILFVYAGVIYGVFHTHPGGDVRYPFLQMAGLLGYLSLSASVIMNRFRSKIMQFLGRPFLSVHHIFALSGFLLIILHPVLYVLITAQYSAFIPVTSSLYLAFANGGRIALPLLCLAVLAVLFRTQYHHRWKILHRLTYPALILGIIHANLIGSTFEVLPIRFFFNFLALCIVVTGILGYYNRQKNRHTIGKPV